MDAYRNVIKRRSVLFSVIAFIAAAVAVFDGVIVNTGNTSFSSGNVYQFQIGLAVGCGLISVTRIIRYRKVLGDEKQLKMEYNKENDERGKMIRNKAGMPMLMITSGIMLLAAIIAGYINETVFVTLVIAVMCQLTVGAVTKLYYMKKI